jgi:hypothetical protein
LRLRTAILIGTPASPVRLRFIVELGRIRRRRGWDAYLPSCATRW